jgi:UDP-N-acetylmuramoyl-L-alanyl-D-glutamate--2,6-diaminopimelate ligase
MTLEEVLAGVRVREAIQKDLGARKVRGIEYDSRRVGADFVFAAFPGARTDGRSFAQDAVSRGALAVMSESPRPEGFSAGWIHVEHGRHALATAARNFYDAPDDRLFFTGITGTNGKTTTSYLIEAILKAHGEISGLIGTIEYHLAGEVLPAPNTTPESLDIMRFASELERRGGTHLISEVSSHALALGRVWGFHFHTAVFTNLTRDHLDFHGDMERYGAAKRLLFAPEEGPPPRWAVLNADDSRAQQMQPNGATRTVWYGSGFDDDLRAENVRQGYDGLHFDLCWEGERQPVESFLVGLFNVSNILAAAGAALSYGVDLESIARGVAACRSVPGRFERIDCGQPFVVIVDYAHTDDALRRLIVTARELTWNNVITLFGCGGDRDRSKRPVMGMVASEFSDYVVLTSDNPRSEDPLAILNDALVGVGKFDTPYVAESDRATAIRLAIEEAGPGDVVLLAGKGHETYQILKDRTIVFDDRVVAREVLRTLGYDKA